MTTLASDTAYHSFAGEVEARTPPRYAAFIPSARHQLSRIAREGTDRPGDPGLRRGRLYAPGMSVSLVTRQYGIAPNQVFTWRRLSAEGALSAVGAGEEVVEGHACVKRLAVLTGAAGRKHEVLCWFARDLKYFPIRIGSGQHANASPLKLLPRSRLAGRRRNPSGRRRTSLLRRYSGRRLPVLQSIA